MSEPHFFPVQIYYEDTDHSGLVYHANYLRFFERAREHFIGVDELLRMAREEGQGFVVHKLTVTYREGAGFGDLLVVRTTASCPSEYRLVCRQDILRQNGQKVLVAGVLDLVCVDASKKLIPLPERFLRRFGGPEPV